MKQKAFFSRNSQPTAHVLYIVILCFVVLFCACGGGKVGDRCSIRSTRETITSSFVEERVIEVSAACDFPYCISNASNTTMNAYCTGICDSAADCPAGYSCEKLLALEILPPGYERFEPLLGKKACIEQAKQP